MMGKVSKKCQRSGLLERLFLFTAIAILLVATVFLGDCVKFCLQGDLIIPDLTLFNFVVCLGIKHLSILKFPTVTDINDDLWPVRKDSVRRLK
ncbi:putative membrane protein [Staphylococcus phage vB_SauH_DELF3]|nr:putative membrane protein [Staphylococcus phage vB_SauH_DELF3]